jgi:hypothetical protein
MKPDHALTPEDTARGRVELQQPRMTRPLRHSRTGVGGLGGPFRLLFMADGVPEMMGHDATSLLKPDSLLHRWPCLYRLMYNVV